MVGTHEGEPCLQTGLGKKWVLGQKTVAGVDRVSLGADGHVNDAVNSQVAVASGARSDRVGFVGVAHVQSRAVHV